MRRTLLAALACGALAVATGAAPATAGDDSYFTGECGFAAVQRPDGDTFTGEIDAVVVLASSTHGNAVAARVTCVLQVNGVARAEVSATGLGAVVLAAPLTYDAGVEDLVRMCTVVDYLSDATPTETVCSWTTQMEVPPQAVMDTFGYLWPTVDAVVCPVFRDAAPGAEPVRVDEEGDVYVAGEFFWDCPDDDVPLPPPPSPPVLTLSGAGYNDGTVGMLLLFPPAHQTDPAGTVATACAFASAGGSVTLAGRTVAPGADASYVRCRLVDPATGTTVSDAGATAAGPVAGVAAAASGTGLTVCTEGWATWGGTTRSVGPHCRPAV